MKPVNVQVVLSLALLKGWHVNGNDVNNTFFSGDLNEKVYMKQNPRFEDDLHSIDICQCTKSLFGLKQASYAWFNMLASAPVRFGFTSSKLDQSLFV